MSLGLVFIYGCVAFGVGFLGALVSSSYIFSFPVNRIMGWSSFAAMIGGLLTVVVTGVIYLITQTG